MADQPEVRNDRITVPKRLDANHVRALALQKAQHKVRRGRKVSDLQLGDSNPVGGDSVEWSYSYQVV
jgi:F0F1-type ATP synthase beta subunit